MSYNHSPRVSKPNFLVAGSGESGTSWLYACLLQHPEVFLPAEMRPEPHFFFKSAEYAKGFEYYLDRYFASVPASAKAIGERSSSYMFGPLVASRIHKHLPEIKIIIMLREPVERAYSNWRFSVQSGLEWKSFESAIQSERKRVLSEKNPFWKEVQPYAYVARSMYAQQLERFFAIFPKENILVLNSDIAKQDEHATLHRVCEFLKVDTSFRFSDPGTFPTSSIRSRWLQCVLRKVYGRRFDRLIESTRIKDSNENALGKLLLKWNSTKKHPKLQPSTRAELEEMFRKENKKLKNFIDWDPQDWHRKVMLDV